MSEILRMLRDEPNWNPSFGPGGLSRHEAKVWHETCVKAADHIERLESENKRLVDEHGDMNVQNVKDEKTIERLRAALEWEQGVAGDECAYPTGKFCFENAPESPDLWCTYCRIESALKGEGNG